MLKSAIIVASGTGNRYTSKIPKQFIYIYEKRVIEYTIAPFIETTNKIILVITKEYQELASLLFSAYKHIECCIGGETRHHSVLNGLKMLQPSSPDLVAIHDGVRPLVSQQTINQAFITAKKHGSAIPIINISDTLWKKNTSSSLAEHMDRELYTLSQTPQTFIFRKIFDAYLACEGSFENFTDCAGIYNHMYQDLTSFSGDKTNIKLTTNDDLELVQFFLSKKIDSYTC